MSELPEDVRNAVDTLRRIHQGYAYRNSGQVLKLCDFIDPPPKTITRKITYPEPLGWDAILESGRIHVAAPSLDEYCYDMHVEVCETQIKRGLAHATKEAAIAHGKALAGVSDE